LNVQDDDDDAVFVNYEWSVKRNHIGTVTYLTCPVVYVRPPLTKHSQGPC